MIMSVVLLMVSVFYTVDAADVQKDFDTGYVYAIANKYLRSFCETDFTPKDLENIDYPSLCCIVYAKKISDEYNVYQQKAEQYCRDYSSELSEETEQALKSYLGLYGQAVEHKKRCEAACIDFYVQKRTVEKLNSEIVKRTATLGPIHASYTDCIDLEKLCEIYLAESRKLYTMCNKQLKLKEKMEFPQMSKKIKHIFLNDTLIS